MGKGHCVKEVVTLSTTVVDSAMTTLHAYSPGQPVQATATTTLSRLPDPSSGLQLSVSFAHSGDHDGLRGTLHGHGLAHLVFVAPGSLALLRLSLRLARVVAAVQGFPKPLAFGSLERPLWFFRQAKSDRLLLLQMLFNLADTGAQSRSMEQPKRELRARAAVVATLLAVCTQRVCLRASFRRRGLSPAENYP